MWKQGTYSGGQSLASSLPSELCVPLGLGLSNKHDIRADDGRDSNPLLIPAIGNQAMDDLLERVLHPRSKKRQTRRRRP
jgi:hypothetical protein